MDGNGFVWRNLQQRRRGARHTSRRPAGAVTVGVALGQSEHVPWQRTNRNESLQLSLADLHSFLLSRQLDTCIQQEHSEEKITRARPPRRKAVLAETNQIRSDRIGSNRTRIVFACYEHETLAILIFQARFSSSGCSFPAL